MRKLLVLILTLASFGFFGFGSHGTEAKASALGSATPQVYTQQNRWQNRRWRNNRVRTVRTTRIVRRGYRTYRETYLVRYYPNGRTTTTLIDRDRIG